MAPTLRILSLLLVFSYASVDLARAQRGCDEVPASLSEAAGLCQFPCDGSTLVGATIGYTPGPNNGWCGSIENDQYIAFIAAGPTVVFSYEVDATCPPSSGGIQFGIYNFDNQPIGTCIGSGATPGATGSLTGNNLVPCTAYLLRIDGFAGAECEFQLTPVSGFNNTAPPVPGPITGPTATCLGADVTLRIPRATQSCLGDLTWDVQAGPGLQFVMSNPPSGTPSEMREITITIPDEQTAALAPGTCEDIVVRTSAVSLCGMSQSSAPFTIRVCHPQPTSIRQTICEGETYTAPNGQQFSYNDAFPPGSDIPIILDPVSVGNPPCPRRDTLFLEAGTMRLDTQTVILCGAEAFTGCATPDPPVTSDTSTQFVTCVTLPQAGQTCTTTTSFTVIRLEPVAEISGPSSIPGGGIDSITLSATPGSSVSNGSRIATYSWDRGAGTPVMSTESTLRVGQAGVYRLVVSVTDSRGVGSASRVCTAETTFEVTSLVSAERHGLPTGASVTLTPNPAGAHAVLRTRGLPAGKYTVEVFDWSARVMYVTNFQVGAPTESGAYALPTEGWPAGSYVVRLRSPGLEHSLPLVRLE